MARLFQMSPAKIRFSAFNGEMTRRGEGGWEICLGGYNNQLFGDGWNGKNGGDGADELCARGALKKNTQQ